VGNQKVAAGAAVGVNDAAIVKNGYGHPKKGGRAGNPR
jgi:hypothetical protein